MGHMPRQDCSNAIDYGRCCTFILKIRAPIPLSFVVLVSSQLIAPPPPPPKETVVR